MISFDPKIFLIEELSRRCQRNPKYSMRSFARAVGLSPSYLSMLLSGQRPFTTKSAEKIADGLGMDLKNRRVFLKSCASSPQLFDSDEEQTFVELELIDYERVAEWQHFAILSLIETEDFKPEEKWIASRLGISVAEVKDAVRRLQRLDILHIDQGEWTQTKGPLTTNHGHSTAATRAAHLQMLNKAQESLSNDPVSSRDVSAITMAIDPENLPIAKQEIRKFRLHLMNLLESLGQPKEVYHFTCQLYPISKGDL